MNTFYDVQPSYTCGNCGQRVNIGSTHTCPAVPGTMGGWLCPRCGQWVTGFTHACIPPLTIGSFYPPISDTCHHCYCIDIPPSGERTKEHARCCKCSDVRVKP